MIEYTNIDDDKFYLLSLSKRGYDFHKLQEMDADDILDIAEYEEIHDAIEFIQYEKAKNGSS